MPLDERHGFFSEAQRCVLEHIIGALSAGHSQTRGRGPRTLEIVHLILRARVVDETNGIIRIESNDAPVFDEDVWNLAHPRHSIEIVEAYIEWSRPQFGVEIRPQHVVPARRAWPAKAEMPLAHAAGEIARAFEQRRERQPTMLNEQRIIRPDRPVTCPCAPAVAARHQVVAARRADGRRRMSIRESHPLMGQPVDIRGLHFGGPITAEVAVAQIVGEDKDDVGLWLRDVGSV